MTKLEMFERIDRMDEGARAHLITGLDDLVHQAKAGEAANINNSCYEDQLNYLAERYGFSLVRELVGNIAGGEW
jgi:hypothetical protein